MSKVVLLALLGAECSGKSTLAADLAQAAAPGGPLQQWQVSVVPEYLRQWCDTQQRTPRAFEQLLIARTQAWHIAQAVQADEKGQRPHLVVADTTPLMTAIYSEVIFGDHSLYSYAQQQQRAVDISLVLAPDLPWQPDGLQRDGPAMRQRVHARLREVLMQWQVPHSVVFGQKQKRLQAALEVLQQAQQRPSDTSHTAWCWYCESCSDADCEYRLWRAQRNG